MNSTTPPRDDAPPKCGARPSPINARLAAEQSGGPTWPTYVGDHEVGWKEPQSDGRHVLTRSVDPATPQEVLPHGA